MTIIEQTGQGNGRFHEGFLQRREADSLSMLDRDTALSGVWRMHYYSRRKKKSWQVPHISLGKH